MGQQYLGVIIDIYWNDLFGNGINGIVEGETPQEVHCIPILEDDVRKTSSG